MRINKRTFMESDYIWNTLAGLFNAAEAVFMCMIVTRVTGLYDAGVLTIAFAIGNIMMTIGKFGVRNYQVTDAKKQYLYEDYVVLRTITLVLMLICSVGYLFYSFNYAGYSIDKVCVVALITAVYVVEVFEDVVWGEYQVRGFLARGAQLFCARWGSIFAFFFIFMMLFKNMIVALLMSWIISIVVFGGTYFWTYYELFGKYPKFSLREANLERVKMLFCSVLPLFMVSFLTFYINNAPKYAIDGLMREEVQACYGFIAMPVFVIGLLNNFIYQPTLVQMAQEWRDNQYYKISKRLKRHIVILAIMTLGVVVFGGLCGIEALSWLYATNLKEYKVEFCILLLSGGFLAMSGYFGVLLTIMRYQRDLLIIYTTVAILAFVMLSKVVKMYGVMGAAVGYTVLTILLVVMSGLDLFYRIRCKQKNKK